MKRFGLPSFLVDYNSISNPLFRAYLPACNSVLQGGILSKKTVGARQPQENRRMIDQAVLDNYGARRVTYKKDEFIFSEGEEALHYFQVAQGSIKMVTNSPDGQEFIQGIFKASDSFGEPPLFGSFPYPSTAIALESSVIFKLTKEKFLKLLRENFEIHLHLDQVLCQRLKYKSIVLSEISFYDPEHRILTLLNYLKSETLEREQKNRVNKKPDPFIVPFTRQQLADMTGLRVETVIRAVKKMEEDGKLKIIGRKIQF